ncbi:PAS domain S-box-containing protein [Mariniphaga anaerophila]|uniref:histidine kinase n=1 Tax=Mariniphaga anaerophila TaxID=1484053 RepID=A0A1M4YVJ3_9BACT|nr:ATP-binding protein [Mariniphaga anaerophila]SHF09803.1 PAS domain S-box-containing protein [Mariniphaga anaerophila]
MRAEDILKALPVPFYVIDLKKKRIVQTNDAKVKPEQGPCFAQLFDQNTPCREKDGKCLCERMIEKNLDAGFTLESGQRKDKRVYRASVKKLEGDLAIATYSEITREVSSIKEMKINTRRMERAEKLALFGSWEIDLQTKDLFATRGAGEIYGGSGGFFSLEEVKRLAVPKYRKLLDEAFDNLISGKRPYNVRYQIKRVSDGQLRCIHAIAEYRPDKNMVFGVVNDITEVILSQKALHESLADLSLAQKIAKIGNWKYRPGERNLQWSDELLEILERKSFPGNPGIEDFREFAEEDHFNLFKKAVRSAIHVGKPFEHQFYIKLTSGRRKWVEIICRPDKEKGEYGHFLRGTIQDVTSSKLAEIELQRLTNRQTTLIQNLPDAVYMKDVNYRKIVVNKGDVENCGVSSPEELIGKTDFDIYPREAAEKYFKDDQLVIEQGIPVINREEELPGEPKRWILTTKVPLRDVNGQVIGLVGIGHDITLRKQMVEELSEAKQKAEESDKLKSLFLANMSHEIRTPLNAILGFSKFISSGKLPHEKLEYYGKIIESSGQRLTSVINDIIDISLIQANQLKVDYSFFDINDLLEEMHIVYKAQQSEKIQKIDFRVRYCENQEHKVFKSDKNRVFQIFRNLLDNAFKFTDEGTIEFGCYTSSSEKMTLFVKDSGIGIEEGKTNVIFESFRQAQEGFSRRYEGTGLGLAIVSGIVNRLHGKVWVDSTAGAGSTFFVDIPFEAEKVTSDHGAVGKQSENEGENQKKRIVSFEDDLSSIEYMKSMATLLGHNLVNFDNPPLGIEYLRKNKADLVLMDVRLPLMNGFEATRIIKSEFPDLPVIIQTAYAMKGDMEKAFQSGCDDYLAKPVLLKDLKKKIKHFLQ